MPQGTRCLSRHISYNKHYAAGYTLPLAKTLSGYVLLIIPYQLSHHVDDNSWHVMVSWDTQRGHITYYTISVIATCFNDTISVIATCFSGTISVITTCFDDTISVITACFNDNSVVVSGDTQRVHTRYYVRHISYHDIFVIPNILVIDNWHAVVVVSPLAETLSGYILKIKINCYEISIITTH